MNDNKTILYRLSRLRLVETAVLITLLTGLFSCKIACAFGSASVTLSASPDIILADGKSQTTITVTVRDGDGHIAPDGTHVQLTTSLGLLSGDSVATTSGVARVTLTSASSAGTASVIASSFGTLSANGSTHIEFTNDRDAVFNVGQASWIRIDCPQYLVYSADTKIIEAQGRHGSVTLQYKTLQITADSVQIDLRSQQLLARNAVLKRAHRSVATVQLRYDLASGAGTAVILGDGGQHLAGTTEKTTAAQAVTITGHSLEVAPEDVAAAQDAIQTNLYRFVDISDSQVVVSARGIAVDPAGQIQFRRAAIYSDGKKILSVPFHVMPLDTQELFGQQVIGFGTQGFFVNVPYYYHVSPGSTGTLYLRNSAAAGADFSSASAGLMPSGIQRPGFALDLLHTYSIGHGVSGNFSLTGLTRSDWGAHWNHNQRIDDVTNTYFSVDSPGHHGFFGSSNVSRQFPGFSLNLSGNASNNPSTNGYSFSNTSVNTYLQTNAHQLGQSGVNFVTTLSAQNGQFTQSTPLTPSATTHVATYSADVRFYTAPVHLGSASLTNGLTLGQNWDQHTGHSGKTILATLGLTRPMPWHGQLGLNYTYRYDPLYTQVASAASNGINTVFTARGQHNLNLNYSASPVKKLSFGLSAGYSLPLGNRTLFSNLTYHISDDWGLGLTSSFSQYLSDHYRETDLTVSRRILGRYLIMSYSTTTKKLHFDVAGSAF